MAIIDLLVLHHDSGHIISPQRILFSFHQCDKNSGKTQMTKNKIRKWGSSVLNRRLFALFGSLSDLKWLELKWDKSH